jgi:hypothetical protein
MSISILTSKNTIFSSLYLILDKSFPKYFPEVAHCSFLLILLYGSDHLFKGEYANNLFEHKNYWILVFSGAWEKLRQLP